MLSNRLEENIILFNNIISISKDTESKNYAGTYAIRATSLYILFFVYLLYYVCLSLVRSALNGTKAQIIFYFSSVSLLLIIPILIG